MNRIIITNETTNKIRVNGIQVNAMSTQELFIDENGKAKLKEETEGLYAMYYLVKVPITIIRISKDV